MEICGGLISYPEIPEEKVDQSILQWFTFGCKDDWNRKRFKQIDKNDTENLVGMDTDRNTSFYANKCDVSGKKLRKKEMRLCS